MNLISIASGARSGLAARILSAEGYPAALAKAGWPVVKPKRR